MNCTSLMATVTNFLSVCLRTSTAKANAGSATGPAETAVSRLSVNRVQMPAGFHCWSVYSQSVALTGSIGAAIAAAYGANRLYVDGAPVGTRGFVGAVSFQVGLPLVGLKARLVCLPSGHDPDSYVRENGAEAMQGQLDGAWSITEFVLRTAPRLEASAHRILAPALLHGLPQAIASAAMLFL